MKLSDDVHATEKIKSVRELGKLTRALQLEGKKIVHCHGVFDLLHIGHIKYFEKAKKYGEVLVVTITPDQYVDKGLGRPAFPEQLRAEAVASLASVDFVAINEWPTAVETLRIIRPDYYVKGQEFKEIDSDRTGKMGAEYKTVQEIGATFAYTEDIVFSSSNLINRYLNQFPDDVEQYLKLLRTRYQLKEIQNVLDKIANMRVLVIGDAILDEYQYCNAIGKSSKDPTMVVQYQSHELFAGGVFAVANHLSEFAKTVDLVTVLGSYNDRETFIRSKLNSNVTPTFFVHEGAPTTLKRRLIDSYSFSKLFEIYEMDDSDLDEKEDKRMGAYLRQVFPQYDVVIVSDFGHGAISPALRQQIIEHSGFTAINTQANAGNRGFHTISKYENFDYACIAFHEFSLEIRNKKNVMLRPDMHRLLQKLQGKTLMVTRGREGSVAINNRDEYVKVPSLSDKIVDRVGAGDAFFAITSLAAALDASLEIISFLGNVVGAMAIQTIGNKKAIGRSGTEKYITALMK